MKGIKALIKQYIQTRSANLIMEKKTLWFNFEDAKSKSNSIAHHLLNVLNWRKRVLISLIPKRLVNVINSAL